MRRSVLLCLILFAAGILLAQQPVLLRNSQHLGFDGTKLALPNGATMIFWNDTSSGSADILAQKIGSNGQVLWQAPRPVTATAMEERIISAALCSDDNIVIHYSVYQDYWDNLTHWVQKFSQAGQALWAGQGIMIPSGDNYNNDISVVPNSIGGTYVIYRSAYPSTDVFGMNLDSQGLNLWPQIPIGSYNSLHEVEAVQDGSGGLLINCILYEYALGMTNHLFRIDAAGDVVGSNPLIDPSANVPTGFSILRDASGEFLLYSRTASGLTMQKMDVNGYLYLTTLFTITHNYGVYTYEDILCPNADGGFAYAVTWRDSDNQSGITLWNLGEYCTLNWTQPTVINLPYVIYDLDLEADNDFWLSWMAMNNENDYNNLTIHCTHVDQNGTMDFAPVQLSSNVGFKGAPVIESSASGALVVWNDFSTEQNSLREQFLLPNGNTLLEPTGREIYGVLSGTTGLIKVQAMGNQFLHIYLDTRYGNYNQLFYQVCGSSGQPLLEENGRALNPGSNLWVRYCDSMPGPNNTVWILYSSSDNQSNNLWLQQISPSGNTLWPGQGICVVANSDSGLEGSKLGNIGNDVLATWSDMSAGSIYQSIYGQKYNNGIPQWTATGKLLLNASNNYFFQKAMHGNYLLFVNEDYANSDITLKALKIADNGDPFPGWPSNGIDISNGTYLAFYLHSGLLDGDLVVFFTHDTANGFQTILQRINSAGQYVWGESGICIYEDGFNLDLRIKDALYDNGVSWLQYDEVLRQLQLIRIGPDGSYQWGASGCTLNTGNLDVVDAKLARFANGTYSAFNASYSNDNNMSIFGQAISAEGALMNDVPTTLVANRHRLFNLWLSTSSNSGIIGWNEMYAYARGDELPLESLWNCRIDAEPVSVDDPNAPELIGMISNYPNPFRSQTNIRFEVKEASPVQVDVYNLKGQLVRSLLNEIKAKGSFTLSWDAKDNNGQPVSDGVYLYKIHAGKFSSSKKMVLLK